MLEDSNNKTIVLTDTYDHMILPVEKQAIHHNTDTDIKNSDYNQKLF